MKIEITVDESYRATHTIEIESDKSFEELQALYDSEHRIDGDIEDLLAWIKEQGDKVVTKTVEDAEQYVEIVGATDPL